MQAISFPTFCQRVSQLMDLDIAPVKDGEHKANTMLATQRVPKPKIQICFSDFTYGETGKPDFIAEFFDTETWFYLGAVGTSYDDKQEKVLFEHFEIGVSPSGQYNQHNEPVEANGELWQFYEGKSLAWAVKSFQMGGARKGRKPIRKW